MIRKEKQVRHERVLVPASELEERRRKRDEAEQSAVAGSILETTVERDPAL